MLLGVCIVLLVAGVSWPTLSQHPLLCRAAAHRAHRALRPLWQDLTAATPEVRLPQAAQDIESTLYNQIIEIRDATLALRPYAPAHLLDRARQEARALGVPARHLDAATEAAWLEVARRRKIRGVEPHGETIPRSHGAVDLDGETHVLMDLARHRRIGARAADRLDAALDRRATGPRSSVTRRQDVANAARSPGAVECASLMGLVFIIGKHAVFPSVKHRAVSSVG